jgi:hypothetical protein
LPSLARLGSRSRRGLPSRGVQPTSAIVLTAVFATYALFLLGSRVTRSLTAQERTEFGVN